MYVQLSPHECPPSGGPQFEASAVSLPRRHRTPREDQNVFCKSSAVALTGVSEEDVTDRCFPPQVALEVIEELCYEMGLHTLEAMEEYAIFLVTNRGQSCFICLSLSHTCFVCV